MRIAIVNDLALAREVLKRLVISVPGYTVAWTAENGEEAARKAAQDRPDIILMDLVMPVLDGAEATRRIMAQSPCPILLVTSSVTGNFNLVYRAMGFGGLDAVNTPTLGPDHSIRDGDGILNRIAKLAKMGQYAPSSNQTRDVSAQKGDTGSGTSHLRAGRLPAVLALGASTGGPAALACILSALPGRFPACIIIIQHIAGDFAPSLARWLGSQSTLPVRLARQGDLLEPGAVLLAGSDDHLVLGSDQRLAYVTEPADHPCRPSVDVFFGSLAAVWPSPGVAVLLTGMGSDGARGLLRLRQLGWHTIAQDQASCVVYGMPKVAADLNAASQILPLDQITRAILDRIPIRAAS
jgi:two-component system, chemotaxis family, response regulator WspF